MSPFLSVSLCVCFMGRELRRWGGWGRDHQPCRNPKPWLPIALIPALWLTDPSGLASSQSLTPRTSLLHVWFSCQTKLSLEALQVYSSLGSCPHLGLQRSLLVADGSRLCLLFGINGVSDGFPHTTEPPWQLHQSMTYHRGTRGKKNRFGGVPFLKHWDPTHPCFLLFPPVTFHLAYYYFFNQS